MALGMTKKELKTTGAKKCRETAANRKKFVRYKDGCQLYSMGMTKFQELAHEAKATIKHGGVVLVNCEILDQYLETFRE